MSFAWTNLQLTLRVYWWLNDHVFAIEKQFNIISGTKIWNQIEIPIWTIQVRRGVVQIATLDCFWHKKSNLGSQMPDLVWSKRTQPSRCFLSQKIVQAVALPWQFSSITSLRICQKERTLPLTTSTRTFLVFLRHNFLTKSIRTPAYLTI